MSDNNKPRICEVLGVKPLEEWTYKGQPGAKFRVGPGGEIEELTAGCNWQCVQSIGLIFNIINYPEDINWRPRWIQEDIEDAKAIRRIWPDVVSVRRETERALYLYRQADWNWFSTISWAIPTLQPGEFATLDEILEADCEI